MAVSLQDFTTDELRVELTRRVREERAKQVREKKIEYIYLKGTVEHITRPYRGGFAAWKYTVRLDDEHVAQYGITDEWHKRVKPRINPQLVRAKVPAEGDEVILRLRKTKAISNMSILFSRVLMMGKADDPETEREQPKKLPKK